MDTDTTHHQREAAERRRIGSGVVPALVVPFIGAMIYFVFWAGTPVAVVVYVATKLFTVAWPVVARFGVERGVFRFQPASQVNRRRSIVWGVGSGVLIAGLMLVVVYATTVGGYVERHAGNIVARINDFRLTTPGRFVLFATFICIVHSGIEEYYWRWYVYGRLTAVTGAVTAHVIAGLAFSAHHFVVLGCYFSVVGTAVFGVLVGVGGAIWSVLYHRTGSLVGSWLSHALVDAAIMVVGYRLAFA